LNKTSTLLLWSALLHIFLCTVSIRPDLKLIATHRPFQVVHIVHTNAITCKTKITETTSSTVLEATLRVGSDSTSIHPLQLPLAGCHSLHHGFSMPAVCGRCRCAAALCVRGPMPLSPALAPSWGHLLHHLAPLYSALVLAPALLQTACPLPPARQRAAAH
jgi:hypothetical protein